MTRLADIEAQIGSMGELLDIVGAMRSLAGMRMQEAQRTVPSIRRYAESVAAGIADTLLLMGEPEPPPRAAPTRLALVLCAAEHGFVGGFNERLVEAAQALLRPSDALFVLGSRGGALALERGRPASWTHPMATRCAAAPETIQRLSEELYRRIARGEIARVEVIYARHRQGGAASIERRLLLPLDLASLMAERPLQPPLHNLTPVALQERLIAEYVFALLTEAAVESIASENAARLAAMESAHDNVSKKLEQLHQNARQARQSEITTELLELVTGAQALANDRS
jgi:F-type H+-transporting ATPase subunit gamma